jgi:formamidopyrimidine-DNA glycosylase
MPEAIEVTLTALHLNHKLKGKEITDISILGGRYSRHPLMGLVTMKKLFPLEIKKVKSKGKFMWFELSDKQGGNHYIMNTYGLEGMWTFDKRPHSNVLFKIKNKEKNKDYTLYFTDQRNFGTIAFTSDRDILGKKLQEIGEDLLKMPFSDVEFHDRIERIIKDKNGKIIKSKANKEIVKILMDQTVTGGVGSGIGNYLASNILYKAKISPYRKLKEFYDDEKLSDQLAEAIRYEMKLAYMTEDIGYMDHLDKKMTKFVDKLRSQIKKNPNHKYNFQSDTKIGNAKFKFDVYRQKTDPKGNPVKRDVIIKGRGTYWVPDVQK